VAVEPRGAARAEERQEWVTIDQLSHDVGTTSRRVRSYQTLGLLPYPELRGRTGLYGPVHRGRLASILRLQEQGFSLESLGVLFRALAEGRSLADLLGLTDSDGAQGSRSHAGDDDELYGFTELQPRNPASTVDRRRVLLSVLPTTVWDENQAS
jgi:DNA-binding transcriptional MerR regulator